jgi:hypothetical protein
MGLRKREGDFMRRWSTVLLVCLSAPGVACRSADDTQVIDTTVRRAETYQLDLAGGDEDGARITEQAQHFAVSEIRRDSSTNWYARYVYAPAAGFVGADRVRLEVLTGSDGASAPTRRRLVTIRFTVIE